MNPKTISFLNRTHYYSLRMLYSFKWLCIGIGMVFFHMSFLPNNGLFVPLQNQIGVTFLCLGILGFAALVTKRHVIGIIFTYVSFFFFLSMAISLWSTEPTRIGCVSLSVDAIALAWLGYKLNFDRWLLTSVKAA